MVTASIRYALVAAFIAAAFFVPSAYAAEGKSYVVDLAYVEGNVSFNSVSVAPIASGESENVGSYRLDVVSFNNETLYTTRFDFLRQASSLPPEYFDSEGRQIVIPNATAGEDKRFVILYIPFFANGKNLLVYNSSDAVVAEASVAYFTNLCGDGICNPACGANQGANCTVNNASANETGILPNNIDPIMLASAGIFLLAIFLYHAFKMARRDEDLRR